MWLKEDCPGQCGARHGGQAEAVQEAAVLAFDPWGDEAAREAVPMAVGFAGIPKQRWRDQRHGVGRGGGASEGEVGPRRT